MDILNTNTLSDNYSDDVVLDMITDILESTFFALKYIYQERIYYNICESFIIDQDNVLLYENLDDESDDSEKESKDSKGFFGTIWQKIIDFWEWIASWFRTTSKKVSESVGKKLQEVVNDKVIEAIKNNTMDYSKFDGSSGSKVWLEISAFNNIASGFARFTSTIKTELGVIVKEKMAIIYKHYSDIKSNNKYDQITKDKYDQAEKDKDNDENKDSDHSKDTNAKNEDKYKHDSEEDKNISVDENKFVDSAIRQTVFRSFKHSFGDNVFRYDNSTDGSKDIIEKITFSPATLVNQLTRELAEEFVKNITSEYNKVINTMTQKLTDLDNYVSTNITNIKKEAFNKSISEVKNANNRSNTDIEKPHTNLSGKGAGGTLHSAINSKEDDIHNRNMNKQLFFKWSKLLTLDEFVKIGKDVFSLVKKLYEKIINGVNNNVNILKECIKE